MRRFDKKKNIEQANILAEQRYMSLKGLVVEADAENNPNITNEMFLSKYRGKPIQINRDLGANGVKEYNGTVMTLEDWENSIIVMLVVSYKYVPKDMDGNPLGNEEKEGKLHILYDDKKDEFVDGYSNGVDYEPKDEASAEILSDFIKLIIATKPSVTRFSPHVKNSKYLKNEPQVQPEPIQKPNTTQTSPQDFR